MKYSTYILDLDGVVYRGNNPIEGSVETINDLKRRGKNVVFISNNSTQSRANLVKKLEEMKISVRKNKVLNCAFLTARYISENEGHSKVFVLGADGLVDELKREGHKLVGPKDAEFLVVGLDRKLTYEKCAKALRALVNGGRFIATNTDPTYPDVEGLMPATGLMVGAIRGMGFEPEFIGGKPSRDAVLMAMELAGVKNREECLLVGDHLEQDVKAAENVGIDSALVLSGVSKKEDIKEKNLEPNFILDKLADLEKILS